MPEPTAPKPEWLVRLEALADRLAERYPEYEADGLAGSSRPTLTLIQGDDESD